MLGLPAATRQVQCKQLPVDRDDNLLELASVSCKWFGKGLEFISWPWTRTFEVLSHNWFICGKASVRSAGHPWCHISVKASHICEETLHKKNILIAKEAFAWGSLSWKVYFTAYSDITGYYYSDPWGWDGDLKIKNKSIKWSLTCLDRHWTNRPFCIYPVRKSPLVLWSSQV